MHIAYVCADPDVPVFGGEAPSVQVLEVVQALGARGVEVDLFATNCYGPRPSRMRWLAVHHLPKSPRGAVARERQAFKANAALQAALEQRGPFDAVYERYSLFSYSAMEYAQIVGIPGLLEVNTTPPGPIERRGLSSEFAAKRVAEWVFKDASVLLPATVELASELRQLGVDDHRIHVLKRGSALDDLAGHILALIEALRAQQSAA